MQQRRPRQAQPQQPRFRRFELAYPTGDRETSALIVEKIVPAEVRVGERYSYTIRVTNVSDAPLANVVINETAQGIEIEQAGEGRPGTAGQPGRWEVGTLAPGATRTMQLTAMADQVGAQSSCLAVDFEPSLCSQVAVVNPELRLRKTAPRVAYSCEQPRFTYAITNTGTGTARDVVIFERLPEGLVTADGQREIAIEIGDLPAGETVNETVELRAQRLGTFESRAVARSANDEAVSAPTAMRIVQPQLAVEVDGPEWQYEGEPVTYRITVSNVSNVPARDARLTIRSRPALPQGERPLGTLAPGQSRTTEVTLEGEGERVQLNASAHGSCAPAVAARAMTALRSVAALRVETVDTQDPINVGESTTYEVRVTNQGRGDAANVQVSAVVPEGLTIVGVDGSTTPRMQGDRLLLGPIANLPAGETASWTVQARADRPGVARFRTEVDSEFLDRPIPDEEPTRVIEARR